MDKKTRGKEKDKKQGGVVSVLKGLGLSYILTCIVFVICAFILTYTDVSMGCIPVVAIITTAVSCVAGGIAASSAVETKGLMWGALTGALYAVILIAVTAFRFHKTFLVNFKYRIWSIYIYFNIIKFRPSFCR